MSARPYIPIMLLALGLGCHRQKDIQRGQQQYDVVQEGQTSGASSTINAPGEIPPPVSTTTVDTTTNFTLPTGQSAVTSTNSLGGTLPPADGSMSMPSTPPQAAPPQAAPPQAPMQAPPPRRVVVVPQRTPRTTPTRPPERETPPPATTTTEAPPPPPPATDTVNTTTTAPTTTREKTDTAPPPPPPTQTDTQPPPTTTDTGGH